MGKDAGFQDGKLTRRCLPFTYLAYLSGRPG